LENQNSPSFGGFRGSENENLITDLEIADRESVSQAVNFLAGAKRRPIFEGLGGYPQRGSGGDPQGGDHGHRFCLSTPHNDSAKLFSAISRGGNISKKGPQKGVQNK
jgi:hypothetical protein